MSRLRSWLGPAVVEGHREGSRLGPEADVDLARAEQLAQRAERALADGHSGVALVPAEQACKLLTRGTALEDEPYAVWAEPARREQAALLRRARLAHVQAALTSGEPLQAVATATAGVKDDPLDEEMTRRLMTAYRDAGQPARALAAYAGLREVLADDFGTDPAPETEALHIALLRDEPMPQPVRQVGADTGHRSGLVERERELGQLRDA